MPPQIARVAATEKHARLSHTAAGKRKSDSVIIEDVLRASGTAHFLHPEQFLRFSYMISHGRHLLTLGREYMPGDS
jgi:hypothetical protein